MLLAGLYLEFFDEFFFKIENFFNFRTKKTFSTRTKETILAIWTKITFLIIDYIDLLGLIDRIVLLNSFIQTYTELIELLNSIEFIFNEFIRGFVSTLYMNFVLEINSFYYYTKELEVNNCYTFKEFKMYKKLTIEELDNYLSQIIF